MFRAFKAINLSSKLCTTPTHYSGSSVKSIKQGQRISSIDRRIVLRREFSSSSSSSNWNFINFFKREKKEDLNSIEKEADENPLNEELQLKLYSEWNKNERSQDVINRIQSNEFIITNKIKKEYLNALILTDNYHNILAANQILFNQSLNKSILDDTPDNQSNPIQNQSNNDSPNQSTNDSPNQSPDSPLPTSSTPLNQGNQPPISTALHTLPGYSRAKLDLGPNQVLKVEVITTRNEKIWGIVRSIIMLGIAIAIAWYFLYSDKKNSGNLPFGINPGHLEVWNVETKFNDVKGVDEAKDELVEIVEYLKNPTKFSKLGARLPKGVLLVGEPGTGKTLLARALAGEANVPFLYTSGSSFDEMFVGVGAKRVRQLFEDAKKLAPCIIFIDEIDSVGSSRKYSQYGSSSREATLNELLTEMDGFKNTQGIIVIGATNFADALDPALLRPGRFDKQVVVPLPDVKGRKDIIDLYLKKTVPAPSVDSLALARGTPGFTGADLANLINIAAIKATMLNKPHVDNECIEEAKDQITMGLARKSQPMDELTRKVTAYHEGGHALIALFKEGATPLHKATIIPRGTALGVTVMLPEKDELLQSKKKLLAQIAVSMGGRAAEEIIFGEDNITGGASSDFQAATSIATAMVTKLGMSNKIGTIYYNVHPHQTNKSVSEKELQSIDQEIKDILQKSYEETKSLLKKHEQELHRLANALLEYETLTAEEIRLVIEGKKINRQL